MPLSMEEDLDPNYGLDRNYLFRVWNDPTQEF
jgi:hypothetical protein